MQKTKKFGKDIESMYVQSNTKKQIGSRYDGEVYNSRYYIKSIKVER